MASKNIVVECECSDCQYMKDKPRVRYGPKIEQYLDMFPEEILKLVEK
jgi:hypothetical protein